MHIQKSYFLCLKKIIQGMNVRVTCCNKSTTDIVATVQQVTTWIRIWLAFALKNSVDVFLNLTV